MQKPARKISNASGQKVIGRFYSYKMGCHILFESIPERNFFYALECDSRVKSYESQPITIQYELDGESRRYTPDVLVNLHDSDIKTYVEIKPADVLNYQAFQKKSRAIEHAFSMLGAEYTVISTNFTERQPQLNNRKLLHRYGDVDVPPNILVLVAEFFSEHTSCLLGEICQLEEMANNGKLYIFALIFRGRIKIEDSARITDQSKLFGWT